MYSRIVRPVSALMVSIRDLSSFYDLQSLIYGKVFDSAVCECAECAAEEHCCSSRKTHSDSLQELPKSLVGSREGEHDKFQKI
jgi:hypothetical protein